jgi:hypothetical protein
MNCCQTSACQAGTTFYRRRHPERQQQQAKPATYRSTSLAAAAAACGGTAAAAVRALAAPTPMSSCCGQLRLKRPLSQRQETVMCVLPWSLLSVTAADGQCSSSRASSMMQESSSKCTAVRHVALLGTAAAAVRLKTAGTTTDTAGARGGRKPGGCLCCRGADCLQGALDARKQPAASCTMPT